MQKVRRVAEKPSQRRFAAGKPVILALSLVCIVLAAGLVATFVIYSPVANEKSELESQIAEKNNIISSLQTQIQALQSSLSQANSALQAKDNQTTALSAQIANLNEYLFQYQSLNLSSSLLYQQAVNMEAGANVTVWNDMLQFAGYVTVQVQSTSNTTYIEVVYSAYGVNYDGKVTVGSSGVAAFPVLPSQMAIIIGNEETANAVSATVTATYTY